MQVVVIKCYKYTRHVWYIFQGSKIIVQYADSQLVQVAWAQCTSPKMWLENLLKYPARQLKLKMMKKMMRSHSQLTILMCTDDKVWSSWANWKGNRTQLQCFGCFWDVGHSKNPLVGALRRRLRVLVLGITGNQYIKNNVLVLQSENNWQSE